MFDIGWTELLLVGIVALIVVGPEDLPKMFRTLGRFTGRAKGLAREFSSAMSDAADSTGVKDIQGDLKNMTSKKGLGLDALDDMADSFDNWNPMTDDKPAEENTMLSPDRAAAAAKIEAATAQKAAERLAQEAKDAEAVATEAAKTEPVKKTAAPKKTAATTKSKAKTPAKKTAKKAAPKTGDTE